MKSPTKVQSYTALHLLQKGKNKKYFNFFSRFVCDVDSLSGGEKTIASLALFFAVNKVINTPFILLDECDAHLDSDNASKMIEVIKKAIKDWNI